MRGHHHLLAATGLLGTVLLTGSAVSYYEESLPSTMNPLFARSMVDHRSHELVFDRLFYRSAITNEIRSRVVEKYEMLDGGRKLKLHMKGGIKWHDGKLLTAEDVCFTVDAMLDETIASPVSKPYREAIYGCAWDKKENSVTIELRKIYHNPRDRVAFPILPKHMPAELSVTRADSNFSHHPVGSGPMKASRGTRGVQFEVVPNTHHNAAISMMQQSEGGDPTVQVKTLISSGVHGIVTVPPPLRPEAAASDDVGLKSYDLRSWWFVAVNTHRGPLQNPKIRQALDLSIDRNELRELTIGVDPDDPHPPCEFISGPFVSSSPYYNRAVKPHERSDRARARQLMIEAGAVEQAGLWVYNGVPITLKIGMNSALEAEARDLAIQVSNQLQAGGFNSRVYNVSSDDWGSKAVTGKYGQATSDNKEPYDLLIGKWSFGLVEDVNPLFETRTSGGKGALNIFNYSNPHVDRILGEYNDAKTDTEAQDAYHKLHGYLADDLPYLFLWKLDTKSAWRNEIRSNTISPFYYFTEFDAWRFDQ